MGVQCCEPRLVWACALLLSLGQMPSSVAPSGSAFLFQVSSFGRGQQLGDFHATSWLRGQVNLRRTFHDDQQRLCVFERLYKRETYEQARAKSDAYVASIISRIPTQHGTNDTLTN